MATNSATETRRKMQIRLEGFSSDAEVCQALAGLFGNNADSYSGSIRREATIGGAPLFIVDRDVCEGGDPDWGPKDCATGASCGPLTKGC
jgi:hypothetical protein